MKPLEIFRVESPDTIGAKSYELVTRDVLADLELTTVLGRLWEYIDPVEPVFILCALIRTGIPPIRIKDMADITTGTTSDEGVLIAIINEGYVVSLLSTLVAEYGRENISQPDKKTVAIATEDKIEVAKSVAEVVIADPRREVDTRLADALLRITPEGFRVRHHVSTESEMLFVASEDAIKPEWIDQANDMMNQLKDMSEEVINHA
jgi:putative methanogenesis marker protein 17